MVMASAPQPDRMAAARAFARSLNIVLKHVRLIGSNMPISRRVWSWFSRQTI